MADPTHNPPPSPTSKTVWRSTRPGMRVRPVTKLRTIDETADLLAVSPRTVRRLIDSGALPAHHLRRLIRISDDDIAALLAATRSF